MSEKTIREVVKEGEYFVLDTETTGLDGFAEIVQISIVDSHGVVRMDKLIKPVMQIPAEATAIHGITNEMVAQAEPLPVAEIASIITGQHVIVYNLDYDMRLLYQSARVQNVPFIQWLECAQWYCAMKEFAEVFGDWNPKRKQYKWQKLTTACQYFGVTVNDAHTALGDCKMTLEVCKAMFPDRPTLPSNLQIPGGY